MRRQLFGILAFCAFSARIWAAGSGLNVVVVVNQNSTNSVQLGNYYCEKRQVPPQNVLRINWTGANTDWSLADFTTSLRDPLLSMVNSRQLTNQIDYVLLSMDIPFRIEASGSYNSTTAALFYGFKSDTAPPLVCLPPSCSLPDSSSNSYAFSEMPFRNARPDTASTNSFLTLMLTDTSLAEAKVIVDRAVASDSSFPTQTVYLARTTDDARSVRFVEFDNAILATRVRGDNSLVRIDSDATSFTNLLGLLTGLATLSLPVNAFAEGAMGDSLTSFGGIILGNSGQTSLLAFLNAGAAGSYGTVWEPCNYTQKFPDPQNYFYQDRGFCLAEAYYQSVRNPYQGLFAGEPLAAPFARRGAGAWNSPANGAVLSGQAALNLSFVASATNLPLGQVDLFMDGNFVQMVTNIPAAAGNAIAVTLNGHTVNYTVPSNATESLVAAGLASALNAQTNTTGVAAYAVGDRIELQSLNPGLPASNVTLSASTSLGSAAGLTTQVTAARPTFVDIAPTGFLGVLVSNTPAPGDWLRLDIVKTNGVHVTVSVTNNPPVTNVGTFTQSLVAAINSNPSLQGADGVLASDYADDTYCGFVGAQFTLYARSAGWAAARIQATLTAATNLLVLPNGTNRLEDNLGDLRPRNHLYVTAGVTNLPITFGFNTATQADGFHELTAVAYEGSHVRTQTGVSRNVRIQNSALAATLTTLVGASNTTLETTLRFSVAANTNNIAKIEFFSTGGSLSNVLGQTNAIFSVAGTNLGLGLHSFYAVVTATDGKQYRTETKWIRLVNTPDAPFLIGISRPPMTISWPATAGRSYDILSATNLTNSFALRATVTPSNSPAQWLETNVSAPRQFYRVRTSN